MTEVLKACRIHPRDERELVEALFFLQKCAILADGALLALKEEDTYQFIVLFVSKEDADRFLDSMEGNPSPVASVGIVPPVHYIGRYQPVNSTIPDSVARAMFCKLARDEDIRAYIMDVINERKCEQGGHVFLFHMLSKGDGGATKL